LATDGHSLNAAGKVHSLNGLSSTGPSILEAANWHGLVAAAIRDSAQRHASVEQQRLVGPAQIVEGAQLVKAELARALTAAAAFSGYWG